MAALNYEIFRGGRVVCQECGKDFAIIAPAHLKKHDMTTSEYKSKYPDAPLSSASFQANRFDHRGSILFKDKETLPDVKLSIEDSEITKPKKFLESDGIPKNKLEILNFLLDSYPNIENNFQVKKRNPITNAIEYIYITDMADPKKKVIFDFPNSFWHNKDSFPDHLKFKRLKNDDWIIITVDSILPTAGDLEDQTDVISD